MIRPSYAVTLARAKLRSKRGMLIASIVVASLLFAALIAMVIVFTGAEKSANDFIKKAGNDRYLVKTSPYIPLDAIDFANPSEPSLEDIRAIRAFETQYYQDLKASYEALDLEYDESLEIPALTPAAFAPETLPEEQRVSINWQSPVIHEMKEKKAEAYAKTATNRLSDLKKIGETYGATGYYIAEQPSFLPVVPSMRLVQNDKEDFASTDIRSGDFTSYGYYTNAIYNGMYTFTDQTVLDRYLLTTDTSELKGIPVIVSAQEAAALFGEAKGIGAEPTSAREKNVWLQDIQTKLGGQTYQACYRNIPEQAMLEKIQHDYAEMQNNDGVPDYQKPSLIYDYPKEACGDILVQEDTRTDAEKQAEREAEDTQKALGTYIEPAHRLMTFQIVGIRYAQPHAEHTAGLTEYLQNLLVSKNPSFGIDIPLQMYESLPNELKINDIQSQDSAQQPLAGDDFAQRVLEFSTVNDARAFLDTETCPEFETTCDKQFLAAPYGSNYLILDEIGALFRTIATIAFPAGLGLAAVIIWFTISRMMTENRKETAVYRAMGAKRRDVTSIYLVYILIVALKIAVLSLLLGVTTAFAINYIYGATLTDTATAAFGIIDDAPTFSLFNLESPLLLVIVGSIFLISIIASIQPLVRNVRRNPIRDMREE